MEDALESWWPRGLGLASIRAYWAPGTRRGGVHLISCHQARGYPQSKELTGWHFPCWAWSYSLLKWNSISQSVNCEAPVFWFVPSTKGRVDGGWVSRWVCWWVHFEDKCRTGNDPAAVSLPQVNGPGYNWHSPPPAQCLVIFLSHHSTLFSLCRTFEEDPGLSVALCRLVNRCYPPALKWSRADELTSRDQAIARLQMDRRLGPGSICLHWRSNCNVEYHQLQSCLL